MFGLITTLVLLKGGTLWLFLPLFLLVMLFPSGALMLLCLLFSFAIIAGIHSIFSNWLLPNVDPHSLQLTTFVFIVVSLALHFAADSDSMIAMMSIFFHGTETTTLFQSFSNGFSPVLLTAIILVVAFSFSELLVRSMLSKFSLQYTSADKASVLRPLILVFWCLLLWLAFFQR